MPWPWNPSLSAVFPHLVKELNASLHVTILLLLFLALALALVSMGFAILNIIQVPYRAVNGPGGICLWNVLAGKEPPREGKWWPHHQAGLPRVNQGNLKLLFQAPYLVNKRILKHTQKDANGHCYWSLREKQAVDLGSCQEEGDGKEKVHDFKKANSFSKGGQ